MTDDTVETKVSLSEALGEVARMRAVIDKLTGRMSAMIQQVKDTVEYRALESTRADAASLLTIHEDRAKALALEAYAADQKKTRPGVTIKTFTDRRLIYDYNTAFKWAETSAKELIVLDTRLFEKHALAVAKTVPVPCVEIVESKEDRAQIASDLSAFLEE